MFDISKGLDDLRGVPPYASEIYGVYQPLLGWEGALTKEWVRRGGTGVDPNIRRILDGRILPGPTAIGDADFLAVAPLVTGGGRSPWTVVVDRRFDSRVLDVIGAKVQAWVDSHEGKLPGPEEWKQLIEINDMLQSVMPSVNKLRHDEAMAAMPNPSVDVEAELEQFKARFLDAMRYESQIGAMLGFYADAQAGFDPSLLANLFRVRTAASLDDVLRPTDPMEQIDMTSTAGALSPVGIVHIFRQWFFDLGHFEGEPVEHVWLAPGTTIELIEVSTRRQLVEQQEESATEATQRAERSATSRTEVADAVKDENANDTKLGVSTTSSVNYGVYSGTVSANYGVESTRKAAREHTNRSASEQTEKLASEIRQSRKSVFRTVTESTDTRSRRYVVENRTDNLLNYELRRKMRRVGVQLQDMGSRLCWQVFIDDPGADIGLSELMHFAAAPEIKSAPDDPPVPAAITKRVSLPLPFKPVLDYTNNTHRYDFQGAAPNGVLLGLVADDGDDDDSQIVIEFRGFRFDPPELDYELSEVRLIGVQGGKLATVREIQNHDKKGGFDLVMQQLHFGGEGLITVDVDLVWTPTDPVFKRRDAAIAKAEQDYTAERERLLRNAHMDEVRQRIDAAAGMSKRPSWDLREEERTVVYRKLVERLMLDTWQMPDGPARARVGHLRSELVRTIFDVDQMMYFVAPEWWMPRKHQAALQLLPDAQYQIDSTDLVEWGDGTQKRASNYLVTENSAPARLGSSLGWLMQLDGDQNRNAFLNAPWVKAVIPIRPGWENEALKWLQSVEGHEDDGWDLPYLGNDDPDFDGKTVGEVLAIVANELEKAHVAAAGTLATDKVFENGFDPLAKSFDADVPAGEPFSQWLTILPTDQIVAVEYEPTDLRVP